MRYIVYTDGAGSPDKNIIGCSYLILTETNYINSESVRIKGMSNPTHAETISVGLAAAYFLDNVELNPNDTIEFHIDCTSTINYCNDYANNKNRIKTNNSMIVNSIFILRKLRNKCNIRFCKVRSHKHILNPNTYVDRLAKLAIRR